MNKFKYILLFLLFTTIFVQAERNPLLNIKMDRSNSGIVDIGVNNESSDQLTTYIKELVSHAPEKRSYPQEILLQERNVTREDCITDQFGIEGCTIAAVDCVNNGEKLDTPAVDHTNTISGIAKIAEEKTREVTVDVGENYALSNTKSTIPSAWSGILNTYPIYTNRGQLYKYKFFAPYDGTYYFKFKANGTGTLYVDDIEQGTVSDANDQLSASVWLSGQKEHTISFKAYEPTGDIYHGAAATISYPNSTSTPFWNTLEGQTGGLSYTTTVYKSYIPALSCDYSAYISYKNSTGYSNGQYYDYSNSVGYIQNWNTYSFYANESATYTFYYDIFPGWCFLNICSNYRNIISIDGSWKVDSSGKYIGFPNPKPYFQVWLNKGVHTIEFYNNVNTSWKTTGTWASNTTGVKIYKGGTQIWNSVYCQIAGADYTETTNHTQPNYYELSNTKATIPPAWTGILYSYPINFDNNRNKTFLFYASETGSYTINLKAYIKGDLYIDGNYVLNTRDYRYQRTTTINLSQGEHRISFIGDHSTSPYSGWATTIIYNGTMIWNTLKGQVAGTTGTVEEKYIEYNCPEGFTDTSGDNTVPGNTCKKTYTWRSYSCPSDVNENGMSWTGPVINAGGDCGGVNVADGGICPGQPSVVNKNCVRDLYTCPTDSSIDCVAKPNSTESQNIANGYKYIAGYSNQTMKKLKELKECPETSNPIYFCPTGWTKTTNTRECIKSIDPVYDIKPGDSQSDCTADFRYEKKVEACVRINDFSNTIVLDENNNAFYITDQKQGYDDTLNICISNEIPICNEPGFTFDTNIGKCVKSKFCAGTTINGKCVEKPIPECPTGMIYDKTTQKCSSEVICNRGTFNNLTKTCVDENFKCPSGMTYNEDINKCEKDLLTGTPSCPTYDGDPTYDPITGTCRIEGFDEKEYTPLETGVYVCNDHYLSSFMVYVPSAKKLQILYINASPDYGLGENCSYAYKLNNMNYELQDNNLLSFYTRGEGCNTQNFDTVQNSIPTVSRVQSLNEMISLARQYGAITSGRMSNSSNNSYIFNIAYCGAEGAQNPIVVINRKSEKWKCPTGFQKYPDYTVCSKIPECPTGMNWNAAYKLCYLDEGADYEYNFEVKKVYYTPSCFTNGSFDNNLNKCSYPASCPSGSSFSLDGLSCLSVVNWTCSDSTWTYSTNPSPFTDLVGSCLVPTNCPDGTSEERIGTQTYCVSQNMNSSCEDGYSVVNLPNRGDSCVAAPFCKPKWLEDDFSCSMTYYWEEYICPDGWEGPLTQAGGDCKGSCDYNGCDCDSPVPPANNCRQMTTNANNGVKIEKRRPIEIHNIISGETLAKPDFGTMRSQICSEFPEDCTNYIDLMWGEENKICFRKSKIDKESCFEVEGCSFYGKLVGIKQLGDTINIQAVNNSKFDYREPFGDGSWDSYGFSISRHALLLSDGNWYIAENSVGGFWRGCGEDYINGLGGTSGFKTIPNSNYHINIAEPAARCLMQGDNQVTGDCAKDIDVTIPDGLTLISISDLESVVANVFVAAACTVDNLYDEHFVLNYDVQMNRVGSGALAGTSFENEQGSTIVGEGYGHDVIHSLTLVNKNTLFGGYEKALGFRGVPNCGIYEYSSADKACITPINYSKWLYYGEDSDWSQKIDGNGDNAMYQSYNTTSSAFYISPYEFDSYNMDGYIGVGMKNDCGDDDTVGLVFGFKDEKNYYGLFWGGDLNSIYGNPNYSGGTVMAGGKDNGVRLAKIVNGIMTTLGTLPNSEGWKCGIYSHFRIKSDDYGIQVWKDDTKIFDLPNEKAPQGKAGYYGLSQANAYYKGFKVSTLPVCPIGTKLDPVSDRCREIECPANLVLNKNTGMCQQVLKSTCAMNGNVGWHDRTGGIVSVGSSEEAKSYIYLSVNDEGLADFKDGTKWKGFNQATMALRLSDGYWYVSSYLKDINGVNLFSERELPLKTRFLSPSNYIDLEDLNGSKAPILCNFKNKSLKQSICSRKLKITLPGFGLKVEAIADIESLYNIFDKGDTYAGVDDNVFTNYKITINNNKELDYSGTGQMTEVLLDKSDTLVEDGSEVKINDRLRFWDSYEDGYLGFIEFMRSVKREDQIDGFMPENPTPFDLNGLGFTSIGVLDILDGYLSSTNNKTYFIRPIHSNDSSECSNIATRYNLTIHSGSFGNEEQTKIAKVLGANNPGACVLESTGFETPDSVNWVVKTEYSTEGFNFVCSPYKCQADHFCEMAVCPEEYQGGLYPENYKREYPLGSITPDACEEDACDTIDPYEKVCGKKIGCDLSNPRVIELPNGDCEEIYCPPGYGYLNSQTKLCEKMECPAGTHEIPSGDCIKN